jgi:hypothetical protein
MKLNFEELKKEVLRRAKEANACASQYRRALESQNAEELIAVIKDNLLFNRNHSILTAELGNQYERPELFNAGKENTGLFNAGSRNSGDWNTGSRNSGNRNSGNCNSGNRNSGDRNIGDWNSGDRNSGNCNSGYRNIGDWNSGNCNSGDRNSGNCNSGYRNSGVFCTRKSEDFIYLFNKESSMTWDEWHCHPAYEASMKLRITQFVSLEDMTEEEKKDHPKASVCGGYLKRYDYHEAWANMWKKLTEEERDSFKTLPNFDADIFKEITGIDIP